jgi:hypothetical protein
VRLGRLWNKSSRWTRSVIKPMAVLFLLAGTSSLGGCAVFGNASPVAGVEICPMMTEKAVDSWRTVYPLTHVDLQVWMGQLILYCERAERLLD